MLLFSIIKIKILLIIIKLTEWEKKCESDEI